MFYDVFTSLCEKKDVSPNKALTDCKISRTSTAKWREGATPRGVTLQKLANYFGVTADYLLTGEETKKAPTPSDGRTVSDDDIKFALFGGDGDITDAMFDEVKRFAQMVKLREEAEKEKK